MSHISVIVPTELVDNGGIGPEFVGQMYEKDSTLPMGLPYGTFLCDSQWRVLIIENDMVAFSKSHTTEGIGDHLPKLPDCIVLVDPKDAETVKRLLKRAYHTVTEFPYPGTLKTRGK